MTKVKVEKEDSKEGLKHVFKDGSINKKKYQKFKKTPTGKVALINGSQNKTNGKAASQNVQNALTNKNKSPKDNKRKSASPKNAKSPSSKNSSPIKTKVKPEEEEDDNDSTDDINEGISIKEEVSVHGDDDEEDDDDDSSNDGAMPDIFGTSLADETDEDDEEFEADSDDVTENNVQSQGVKMFKGVKDAKGKQKQVEKDDDTSDEDEDGDGKTGIKTLLGNTLEDEEDDEDFEVDEEDDDDDEDEDDDEEDVDQAMNTSATSNSSNDNVEEDDDDDSDEDEEEAAPGLKALLGNSIAEDDDDDEDFEGEEDEEQDDDDDLDSTDEEDEEQDRPTSPEVSKVVKNKKSKSDAKNESLDSSNGQSPKLSAEEKKEIEKRTIYVGNIPKDTTIEKIRQFFKKCGPIESARIRGVIPENPKIPLKVAAITKNLHPKSTTICAYVVYKKEESVENALKLNGRKLDGNYLRIDRVGERNIDSNKAVFVGNLPFTIEDNELWETFKDCGKIESVRIIRDRITGLGRGFGYVNFTTFDGAVLACDLTGTTIKNRQLRILISKPKKTEKKEHGKGKKRQNTNDSGSGSPKKLKSDKSAEVATRNSINAERRTNEASKRPQGDKKQLGSESTSPRGKFQGQKADKKKRSRQDKSSKKKKQMAAKLLSVPKKPVPN